MSTIEVHRLTDTAIDDLDPSPDNLRADLGDLTDLVSSIRALGIIEPLVVDSDNRVLAGHRRLAAAREAGLTTVPVVVRHIDDDAEAVEIMLVENLQRSGLNPIEEATGYQRLADMGMSQREIAERVGCNQSHVSKRLKLMTLPEAARAMVVDGTLAVNDALELAKLVELDADQAAEWIADPKWPSIAQRIRNIETEQRRAASVAEGEASGLIDARKFSFGDFTKLQRDVERDVATHWSINGIGELVWWGPKAKPEPKADGKPDRPSSPPVATEYDLRRQADTERQERRDATLQAAVGHVGRDRVVALGMEVGCRFLAEDTIGTIDFNNPVLEWGDVDQDDHALVIALSILLATTDPICFDLDDLVDADRWAMAALVECGYEMDDSEVEAYGEIAAPERDEVTDAQFAAVDGPSDERTETAPWKAYPFVGEVQLIGGIREHKNVDKLRHAVIYEQANANRPLVLAALTERIDELTGTAL